jgi:hypothetical protein
MAGNRKTEPQFHLETAHILFLDVVGYSKLLVSEQREVVQQLTDIVRNAAQVRRSDASGKLIRIPLGDSASGLSTIRRWTACEGTRAFRRCSERCKPRRRGYAFSFARISGSRTSAQLPVS